MNEKEKFMKQALTIQGWWDEWRQSDTELAKRITKMYESIEEELEEIMEE